VVSLDGIGTGLSRLHSAPPSSKIGSRAELKEKGYLGSQVYLDFKIVQIARWG
jgi:hypothetical protein